MKKQDYSLESCYRMAHEFAKQFKLFKSEEYTVRQFKQSIDFVKSELDELELARQNGDGLGIIDAYIDIAYFSMAELAKYNQHNLHALLSKIAEMQKGMGGISMPLHYILGTAISYINESYSEKEHLQTILINFAHSAMRAASILSDCQKAYETVHMANMAKCVFGHSEAAKTIKHLEKKYSKVVSYPISDGRTAFVCGETGKLLKPYNWQAPDLQHCLKSC